MLALAGFALYSSTKLQRFREAAQPRVISLSATALGAPELQPLKAMGTPPPPGGLSARGSSSSLVDAAALAAAAPPPRV